MIGRKVLAVAAALVLAVLVAMPAANAAKCPKLCKEVIVACRAKCEKPGKGKCKRACKKRIVGFCKDNASTCPASPSGAFIDVELD